MTTRLAAPAATRTGARATTAKSRLGQRRNRYGALGLACALLLAAPAGASARVFLDLPGVPGDSQVKGFEKQIELNSFQFGLSNPVQMATDKVRGTAKFSEIVVTKTLDKASPALMLRTANMAAFPSARLQVTRSSATGESTVVRYCLTNVQLTSFSQSGSGGGDLPSESVSLSYGTIVQSYTEQAADGKPGDVFTSGWDVIGNLQFGGACDK